MQDQVVADMLALDNQVCFALSIAHRTVTAIYRPLLEPMGLTHPQYLVMLALWDKNPRSLNELAGVLQQDTPTLSPLLKRLEVIGLITRTRSQQDERRLDIEVTSAGWALRTQALRVPEAVVNELGTSIQELTDLRSSLWKIINSASRAAPEH